MKAGRRTATAALTLASWLHTPSVLAQEQSAAPSPPPPSLRSPSGPLERWGLATIAASLATGALLTSYGLSIDCKKTDHACHRRAALPIWGGVGVAASGSLVGLYLLQLPPGPRVSMLRVSWNF